MITHKFELAGLGKAPFRLIGMFEKRCSGEPNSQGITVGAPGQPAGTCDFCGNGIANCFEIQSSDGKRFIVGSDCVLKTEDRGLVDTVKREANKKKSAHKAEVDQALIQKYDWALRQYLMTLTDKHPNTHYAGLGKTIGDYHLFAYNSSGRTGKVKLIKQFMEHLAP